MADFHSFDSRTFQSTLPARGATSSAPPSATMSMISIHAPRTGSDQQFLGKYITDEISIHAPRTGSDKPPADDIVERGISIHAPRTGSDAAGH